MMWTAGQVLFILVFSVRITDQACYFGADIALVLDIDEFTSNADVEEARALGSNILNLVAGHDRSLASLVTYRSEALVRFTFEDWGVESARDQFFTIFRVLKAEGNQTHHGMWLLRDRVFTTAYGARDNIEDVVVLITNRESSDIDEAGRRAKSLQDRGTVILVIAIGDVVGNAEIQKYASRPDYHIRAADFSQLNVAFNFLKNTAFDCSPCPEGWIKAQEDDGFCYKLVSNRMAWKTAKDNCDATELGARLVVFDNVAQVKWFADEFVEVGDVGVWIGLDRNAQWEPFTYVDATAMNTTTVSWKVGYPQTGLCVHYSKLGLEDDDCNVPLQSVCQLKQTYIAAPVLP